jgi:hypothetical protein
MTIVGLPVLFFLGRWVVRSLSDPAERGGAFGLYVNVTLLTALAVVMVTSVVSGRWLVGESDFSSMALTSLVVWTPIWVAHWWLYRAHRADVSNFHVFVGATAGLGTLAGYGAALLDEIFTRLLDSGTAVDLAARNDADVSTWVIGLAVGGLVFGWYWLMNGLREARDTLWHAYVVLIGVLGGLIAAVAGAGSVLFRVLQWWLGDPGTSSAVRHFADFIPALVALLVGAAIWFYHRRVLGPIRGDRTEVQRVYDYVVAAVGLVTATVGVVILVIGFQEAVFPPADSMTSEVNILLGALTSLAVGVPLWAQAWRRINRFVKVSGGLEVASPTRRSYLFGVIGLGGVVAAVSLIVLLVVVFNSVLGDGGDRLRNDIQAPVALLVTVGGVAVYHLLLQREEQEQIPDAPSPKQVVLVTGDEVLAAAVRDLTGARVTVLHRLDANGEAAGAGAVAAAIAASEFDQLLVVPDPVGGVQVIPYRR